MYQEKHLLGLLVIGIFMTIFFVATHFINKRGDKSKRLVLQILYILLVSSEVLKYILLFFGPDSGGIQMNVSFLPWHMCSMALYFFPFVAFGSGKVAEFFKSTSFVVGLLAGLLAIFYPSNILFANEPWFYNYGFNEAMISFIYHSIMIMFALYLLTSKIYIPKAKDGIQVFLTLSVVAVIAIIINSNFGTDFFMLGNGGGNPLGFIITAVNHFVFLLAMFAIGALFIAITYLIVFIHRRRKKVVI